jgi:hypothetical protein
MSGFLLHGVTLRPISNNVSVYDQLAIQYCNALTYLVTFETLNQILINRIKIKSKFIRHRQTNEFGEFSKSGQGNSTDCLPTLRCLFCGKHLPGPTSDINRFPFELLKPGAKREIIQGDLFKPAITETRE